MMDAHTIMHKLDEQEFDEWFKYAVNAEMFKEYITSHFISKREHIKLIEDLKNEIFKANEQIDSMRKDCINRRELEGMKKELNHKEGALAEEHDVEFGYFQGDIESLLRNADRKRIDERMKFWFDRLHNQAITDMMNK